MFDKLKQLKQLKELQKKLGEESFDYEKEGVRVIMSGSLEVSEVYLNPDLDKEKQEALVKECFNQAIKKVQISMAQRFSGSPGFGL